MAFKCPSWHEENHELQHLDAITKQAHTYAHSNAAVFYQDQKTSTFKRVWGTFQSGYHLYNSAENH